MKYSQVDISEQSFNLWQWHLQKLSVGFHFEPSSWIDAASLYVLYIKIPRPGWETFVKIKRNSTGKNKMLLFKDTMFPKFCLNLFCYSANQDCYSSLFPDTDCTRHIHEVSNARDVSIQFSVMLSIFHSSIYITEPSLKSQKAWNHFMFSLT